MYLKSDEAIDWTELLVSASADDVFMEPEAWRFLKSISRKVLSGDIDAYMETIEKMRPVDDLLDYGSSKEISPSLLNETQREALERREKRPVTEQTMNKEMAKLLRNQNIDRKMAMDVDR